MSQSGSTHPQLLCVIGDPIAHSLSPVMHQAAINALGLNYQYIACRVLPAELGDFVDDVRRTKRLAGFNVTLPHKETILPYLDEISELASRVGAVNTVYWQGNRLCGTNTDVAGFSYALESLGKSLSRKSACVLGAGGASRAIVYALGALGFSQVAVVNRTIEKAQALVESMSPHFPDTTLIASAWQHERLDSFVATSDFIINTTSIGLAGEPYPTLPFHRAKADAVACDIIYRPLLPPFLTQANASGLQCQNGMAMFIGQGQASFQLWTGQTPPVDVMEKALVPFLS